MRPRAVLPLGLALLAASLACNTLFPGGTATLAPPPTASRAPAALPLTAAAAPSASPTSPLPTATRAVPTRLPAPSHAPAATLGSPVAGVRACAYVPGVSTPAVMPPTATSLGTPTPYPLGAPPANTPVDPQVTERQLRILDEFADTIESEYLYPDFNGLDWPALRARYQRLVAGGLTDQDFYQALNALLAELGDDHSYFESPDEAAESDAAYAGNNDYVGIGVVVQPIPEADRAVIVYTFPGGSAAEAGLRAHDSILAVNGEPLLDAAGAIRDVIRGEPGTEVVLTVQRPGEAPAGLTLPRRRVTGAAPVDFCLVPGTRLGYLFLPHLDDETIPGQVRAALQAMTAPGPLDGLVLDNRQNGGGASTVLEALLGFFTSGTPGHFVSRADRRPLEIDAKDIGGSQTVPLVVLVDVDTASYGEVLSGVLRDTGRATLVGQTTLGNVETLWAYTFEDGSRAWIAREAFQFAGQAVGEWEDTGIVPDVFIPTRWDLFTEANDPALAAAVGLLSDVPAAPGLSRFRRPIPPILGRPAGAR
ncbi:MAG: PDZ domain-containing protein [Anaerolineales bacterium]|nr:PDZ domain-containing protein [Anaerolineales bacterium]